MFLARVALYRREKPFCCFHLILFVALLSLAPVSCLDSSNVSVTNVTLLDSDGKIVSSLEPYVNYTAEIWIEDVPANASVLLLVYASQSSMNDHDSLARHYSFTWNQTGFAEVGPGNRNEHLVADLCGYRAMGGKRVVRFGFVLPFEAEMGWWFLGLRCEEVRFPELFRFWVSPYVNFYVPATQLEFRGSPYQLVRAGRSLTLNIFSNVASSLNVSYSIQLPVDTGEHLRMSGWVDDDPRLHEQNETGVPPAPVSSENTNTIGEFEPGNRSLALHFWLCMPGPLEATAIQGRANLIVAPRCSQNLNEESVRITFLNLTDIRGGPVSEADECLNASVNLENDASVSRIRFGLSRNGDDPRWVVCPWGRRSTVFYQEVKVGDTLTLMVEALEASGEYVRSNLSLVVSTAPAGKWLVVDRWKFHEGQPPEGWNRVTFNDSSWYTVPCAQMATLASMGYASSEITTAQYRYTFSWDPSWNGEKVELWLQYCRQYASIFVNGQQVAYLPECRFVGKRVEGGLIDEGSGNYGDSAWSGNPIVLDITPFISQGENVLALSLKSTWTGQNSGGIHSVGIGMPHTFNDSFDLQDGETIAYYGDSVFATGWMQNIAIQTHAWLRLLYPNRNITVVDAGIPGDRSDQLLARLDRYARFAPDVAVVMIGINDMLQGVADPESYRVNLEEIVDKLRIQGVRRVILCSTTPLMVSITGDRTETFQPPENKYAAIQSQMNSVVSQVAVEKNCEFLDLYGIYRAKIEEAGTCDLLLVPDGIHSRDEGHIVMLRSVMELLGLPKEKLQILQAATNIGHGILRLAGSQPGRHATNWSSGLDMSYRRLGLFLGYYQHHSSGEPLSSVENFVQTVWGNKIVSECIIWYDTIEHFEASALLIDQILNATDQIPMADVWISCCLHMEDDNEWNRLRAVFYEDPDGDGTSIGEHASLWAVGLSSDEWSSWSGTVETASKMIAFRDWVYDELGKVPFVQAFFAWGGTSFGLPCDWLAKNFLVLFHNNFPHYDVEGVDNCDNLASMLKRTYGEGVVGGSQGYFLGSGDQDEYRQGTGNESDMWLEEDIVEACDSIETVDRSSGHFLFLAMEHPERQLQTIARADASLGSEWFRRP